MKFYNLKDLSLNDKEIRISAHNLAKRYSVPQYLSDDFVTESYLKVQSTYFDNGGWVSIGGIVRVIQCLLLDYLKANHTKNTYNGCADFEPYLDTQFYEPTDWEKEYELDAIYNTQINLIKDLPIPFQELLYKITLQPLEKVSHDTGRSYNELRRIKKQILIRLRNRYFNKETDGTN